MLRSELISDVREILRTHNIDSEIADRHIMFLLRTKRTKYLRQREIRELGEYRDQFEQTIFMDLELVNTSQVSTLPTGGTILRTVKALPNIVGREVFKHLKVTTVDHIGTEIEVINKERARYIAFAPPGFTFCFKADDGKLYFLSGNISHKLLSKVAVQCVLENPEDITSLNDLTTHLTDYPITGEMWEIIKPEIIQELLHSMGMPIDVTNNKADDATIAQK